MAHCRKQQEVKKNPTDKHLLAGLNTSAQTTTPHFAPTQVIMPEKWGAPQESGGWRGERRSKVWSNAKEHT